MIWDLGVCIRSNFKKFKKNVEGEADRQRGAHLPAAVAAMPFVQ